MLLSSNQTPRQLRHTKSGIYSNVVRRISVQNMKGDFIKVLAFCLRYFPSMIIVQLTFHYHQKNGSSDSIAHHF